MQPNFMYCACDNKNCGAVRDIYMNNDNCGAVCDSNFNNSACYGEASMKYAQCILEFIYEEYRDHLLYMKICERCRCMENRRIFRSIADDELRHSNLFVSAYFLITGKRFCPAKTCNAQSSSDKTLAELLRELYFKEICGAQQYANYAKSVDDECLRQLLMEISEDEKEHAAIIMDMIRRLCACD